jgi:hypothetical protein
MVGQERRRCTHVVGPAVLGSGEEGLALGRLVERGRGGEQGGQHGRVVGNGRRDGAHEGRLAAAPATATARSGHGLVRTGPRCHELLHSRHLSLLAHNIKQWNHNLNRFKIMIWFN